MSQQINLFNPAFRKRRELFTALMLVQALAVLLLLLGGASLYQYRQLQATQKQAAEGAVLLEQERARMVKVAAEYAPRSKSVELEQQVARMEQQLRGEEAVLAVLQGGSLGNTQGYSAYLRAFARQSVNGLWLTDFSMRGAGQDLSIGGRTLRPELVPVFVQRLNQESVIQGGVISALEMRQPTVAASADGKPAPLPNYLEFRLGMAPEAAR